MHLRVFSCAKLTIYPAAQAAVLTRWGTLPRGSPRASVSAALQASRGRCGRPRLAGGADVRSLPPGGRRVRYEGDALRWSFERGTEGPWLALGSCYLEEGPSCRADAVENLGTNAPRPTLAAAPGGSHHYPTGQGSGLGLREPRITWPEEVELGLDPLFSFSIWPLGGT